MSTGEYPAEVNQDPCETFSVIGNLQEHIAFDLSHMQDSYHHTDLRVPAELGMEVASDAAFSLRYETMMGGDLEETSESR